MKKRQQAVLDKLVRIQRFLRLQTGSATALNQGRARAELDELLDALRQNAMAQQAATARSRGTTAHFRTLRTKLRTGYIAPIVAVLDAHTTTKRRRWRLRTPAPGAPTSTLVETAMAVAVIVREDQERYLAEGFPAEFLEQLLAIVDAIRSAEVARHVAGVERSSATAAIGQLVRRAKRLVRVLDALVVANIGTTTSVARAWREAVQGATPADGTAESPYAPDPED